MIRVQPAVFSDAARIAELETACFSEPWSENAIREEMLLPYARFFVARNEKDTAEGADDSEDGDGTRALVGYAGMLLIADEAQIINVAVCEKNRRQGVGSALLRALEDEARRCGMAVLQLEVRVSGLGAQALYRKAGFLPVGKRKNFYRFPTEDALLMNKELAEPV